ncbi:MAG: tRNA uridine-5-carboxymethylaminomethyl(34) synthesis enzyme MnmG, partial [Oscillospiraceae bacterium]|nr:tRNA uridine-5-carboxymethylaminomethyl(34) synthesis enzyme MnmG [Oscillospiraceae bacterium]
FSVEVAVKYEGYLKLEKERIVKFKALENKVLPQNLSYNEIEGLRIEARQKLTRLRPVSIGQASRISGVSPADIAVLLVYLESGNRRRSGR